MTLSRSELSKLIVKKNDKLDDILQKNDNENDKVKCLKRELDSLVYEYYKTICA